MSNSDFGLQEWEAGLPAPEELMPITQTLISQDLAVAFNIHIDAPTDEPQCNNLKENRTATRCLIQSQSSQQTDQSRAHFLACMQQSSTIPWLPNAVSSSATEFLDRGLPSKAWKCDELLRGSSATGQGRNLVNLECDHVHASGFMGLDTRVDNGMILGADSSEGGSNKKSRKRADTDLEEIDSIIAGAENSNEEAATAVKMSKRPRLVWTPQLHKRFIEAVAQLGIEHAVPKTIMQLMNVGGLTRENVASHLQKYRLYLKRIQGMSSEGPLMQDRVFMTSSSSLGIGGSPYFSPNHREDLVPFLMPLHIGNLGAVSIAEKQPFPQSNMGLSCTNGYSQPYAFERMSQTYQVDGCTQQGSPRQQALTLFPQKSV